MGAASFISFVNRWPRGIKILSFGVAYFCFAWLGDLLTFRPSNFTPFWPVSGLYVAVLLLTRPREWPLFLLGALPANWTFDLLHQRPLIMTLGFSVGNSLEAFAGAWLVHRFASERVKLESYREIIILVFFSAIISTTLSASVGTLTLSEVVGLENVGITWLTWWVGDLLGVLVMAPLILILVRYPWQRLKSWPVGRWLEAAGYALLNTALVWVTFSSLNWSSLEGVYLLIPLMVFITLRFGSLGMVLTGFQLACLMVLRISISHSVISLGQSLSLQAFLGTLLFMGLILAASLTQTEMERQAVHETKERFQSVLENSLDAAYRRDLQTDHYDYLSPAIEEIAGWSVADMINLDTRTAIERIHPQDILQVKAAIERSENAVKESGKASEILQYRLLGKDNQYHWLEDHFTLLTDAKGAPRYRLGIVRNITARIQIEEALRLSEAKFRKIFEEAPIGMAIVGADFRFLSVNASFCKMLGYTPTELSQLTFAQITHPEHIAQDVSNVENLRRGGISIYRTEKRYLRKDGNIVHADLTLTVNRDANGNFLHFLAMIEDISERVHLLAELENRAIHDELTGALNRWGLFSVLQAELDRAHRYHHPVGLILFDVDYFKQVNDTYGHATGDHVLREVTRLCRQAIRSSDAMARYGGDEFVVLVPEINLELARQAAERLRQIIENHVFEFEGTQLHLTISVGVTIDLDNQFTLDTFLRCADQALYSAKDAGKNCVRIYTPLA